MNNETSLIPSDQHEQTPEAAQKTSLLHTLYAHTRMPLYWLGFPLLLTVTTAATYALLKNPNPVMIIEMIVLFCIYAGVRAHQRAAREWSKDSDFFRNIILIFCIGSIALSMPYKADQHMSPWGPLGWAILIGILMLITLFCFFAEMKESNKSFKEVSRDAYIWRTFAGVSLIVAGLQQIYLYWATPWVWMPIVLTGLFIFTLADPDLSFKSTKDDSDHFWTGVILFAVGLVSLVCQYWHSITAGIGQFWNGMIDAIVAIIAPFWQYWLGALALIAVCFIIGKVRKNRKERVAERIAAERKEQQRKEYNEKAAKEKETDLLKLSELTKIAAESPEWSSIREWLRLVRKYGMPENCTVNEYKLMTTPLMPLITHSREKNRLAYNGGLFRDVMSYLNDTIQSCFDDVILAQIKKNIQDLKDLKDVDGYNSLRYEMKNKSSVWWFYEPDEDETK